jgi:prepilin-type N-terminal cleavage/methylation domain-containing protein
MKSMLRKEAGITLIELMVVLVLAAVVTAAIYATFIAQQKSYATQTRVSDMQQNARAALMLMERDLRMARFGIGSSTFTVQDFWGNNINQAITITDRNGDGIPEITVVYAAQLISNVTSVSANTVTLNSVTGLGTANGTQYIAFETVNDVYTISNIVGNTLTLTNAPPAHLADIKPSGARAYLVKAITYQVNNNTFERVESDQMGAVPAPGPDELAIANYITGLQAAWLNADQTLLQVTLTGQDTDASGNTMTRAYEAVINIRN